LEPDRLERHIALARAALLWERVWRGLWPASGIACVYAGAALFGLFAAAPGWLHGIVLAATLFGCALALYEGFKDFHFPAWRDGARRLERDAALAHRPISEGDDVLAAGQNDPIAEELWKAHIKRLLSAAVLRLTWPRANLADRDPRHIRFAALAVLIAGLAFARQESFDRLYESLDPQWDANGTNATIDAWIEPPAYTGQAPIYLTEAGSSNAFAAPAGSHVNLRVHGAGGRPRLSVNPGPASDPRFAGSGGEYATTFTLAATSDVHVRSGGRNLGRWHIKSIADNPPMIAFAAKPEKTPQGALKLNYTAGDDYGVTNIHAIITPVKGYLLPLSVDLPANATNGKIVNQTTYRDLTEHPYAGMEINIVLEAKDGAGQTGHTLPAKFKLPQRIFANPLARALIEQRQNLAAEERAQEKTLKALDALTIAPERFYQTQTNIYLAIRASYWSLWNAHNPEDFAHVQDLLWQTALALEQGGLSLAAAQLRMLQQMLTMALARGASDDEIAALLQRYREALQRYLQTLAQNAQPGGAPPPPGSKTLSQQDLETLLKAIEEMAQTGARDQAAQLLAMVQQMLENLQMTQGAGGGGSMSPQDKARGDAVKNLGEMMGRQRELLDKTFRQEQGVGDPNDGGPKGLADKQGQLHQSLEQLQKTLNGQNVKPPPGLGSAGHAMGDAQSKLGAKDLGGAHDNQQSALDELRNGADALAKDLMNGMPGQAGAGQQEDPLGRMNGARGNLAGNGVKVPDQATLERARSILMELRRRAAERGRPQEELDYIDRLLREF
jgi:uncharacterized protein (TIGR02302 family)